MAATLIRQETVYSQLSSSNKDAFDKLQQRLDQIEAMLMHIYGCGGEAFRMMCEDKQDTYLWCCHDLVEECSEMLSKLGSSQA